MGSLEDLLDREACVRLGIRYARTIDARDGAGFTDVFHPDARLHVHGDRGAELGLMVGHEELARMVMRMNKLFDATHHAVSNQVVDLDGDRATGSSACVARHLSRGAGAGVSLIMVIDYDDVYERRDGTWRILERHVRNRWHETVTALTPAQAAIALVADRHLSSVVARLTAEPDPAAGGQLP